VESARADAEEARAALVRFVGAAPEVVEALEAAGLSSPRAIVEAGRETLQALPAVGDRADKIYAAAEEWLAARAEPVVEAEAPPAPATEPEPPPADA